MASVNEWASQLQGTGFYSIVLPFLLVFAIIYGILDSLGLFGDDTKAEVIISLVLSIFAVVFFPLGEFLIDLEGQYALWLVMILMVMIVFELVGWTPKVGDSNIGYLIGIVGVLGVIYLFFQGDPSAIAAIFGTDTISVPVVGSVPLIPLLAVVFAIGLVLWMTGIIGGNSGGNR